eukprot:1298149-Prymnesium_polylepis.3
MAAFANLVAGAVAASTCPSGTTRIDNFTTPNQMTWIACEDLAVPGGGLTLVPARGAAVHLPKSHEVRVAQSPETTRVPSPEPLSQQHPQPCTGPHECASHWRLWSLRCSQPYAPKPDDAYYLGLGKDTVLAAKWDMLGDAVLNQCTTKSPTTGLCTHAPLQ